jgi:hypothetical protein
MSPTISTLAMEVALCCSEARRAAMTQNNAPRHMTKVKRMLLTCGAYATARYLAKRGYTPEQAVTLMYR